MLRKWGSYGFLSYDGTILFSITTTKTPKSFLNWNIFNNNTFKSIEMKILINLLIKLLHEILKYSHFLSVSQIATLRTQ